MPTLWENIKNAWGNSSAAQKLDPSLMEKLAQSFPMPVFVLDARQDKFLWVSSGALWLTKLSAGELFATPAISYLQSQFHPGDTIAGLIRERIPQAEVALTYEGNSQTAHLVGYWIELEPYIYALALQDVTELRIAQEELAQYAEELRQQVDTLTELKESLQRTNQQLSESKEQLRLLAAVAAFTDNAVIITDAEGRALWVNRGFERLTGYTLEEVKGKVPGRLLQGPDTDPNTVIRIREKLRHKEPFSEEILNYTKDGRPYWLRLYITPLTNELNEVTHFLAIELDITEEKNRMQEMERQLEDIRQAQLYASRIFKRFLPAPEGLKGYFSDVQIWNAPLHGVGGDFYFFAAQGTQVVLALGDSTGHGAAAALISAYALTSLWRGTREPVQALSALYEDLLEGVVLSGEGEMHTEGFELALLRYEPYTQRLEYLGAKRPLWIFRKGILDEVRGLRSDINPSTALVQPQIQTFRVQKGDRLYLFSDGVTSQLNPEGKKFSAQRLRSFLQVNQYLPLSEQIDLLRQALEQWRGGSPQTDDILIMALEV
ncbi:MAG: SpoIIE family protein phosphatase [Bacteroidia bacterium]|nr:SpoIIE family protein phosphatase [Bacteroidia bacterium]